VREAFEHHIHLNTARTGSGNSLSEASFYVADLGDIVQKYAVWQENLPGVTPFFGKGNTVVLYVLCTYAAKYHHFAQAVKSNYDRRLLQVLASCGAGFDCASAEEIEMILELGVPAFRIIFTHPCKPPSSLQFSRQVSVELLTFDNEDELRKLKEHYPEARVVLRVFADDPTGVDPLGTKFGAAREDTLGLVLLAKELGMRFEGASFHCGKIHLYSIIHSFVPFGDRSCFY
jgi:ornithine decarboxylase